MALRTTVRFAVELVEDRAVYDVLLGEPLRTLVLRLSRCDVDARSGKPVEHGGYCRKWCNTSPGFSDSESIRKGPVPCDPPARPLNLRSSGRFDALSDSMDGRRSVARSRTSTSSLNSRRGNRDATLYDNPSSRSSGTCSNRISPEREAITTPHSGSTASKDPVSPAQRSRSISSLNNESRRVSGTHSDRVGQGRERSCSPASYGHGSR